MKVTIPTKALLEGVAHAAAVAATKSPKPILECVAIRADSKTGVCLEATDLDVGLRYHIKEAKVEQPGGMVVSAARLLSICREVDEGDTTLVDADGGLTIDTGRSHFQVRGEALDEFPALPDADSGKSLALPATLLQNMIRRTAFATAKEAGRFALHGVQFRVKGKDMEMVATDGRRLARVQSQLESSAKHDLQAIIGPKGLHLLERILGHGFESVDISIEDRQALFRAGPALVVTRLIDGTFPSLDGVIPAKASHAMHSTAGEFASGLRRAALLTTRDAMSVELRVEPGSLVIRSRAREVGEAKVEVPVEYDGSPTTVGFNPIYLQDALKVMEPGSAVSFEFTNAKSPGRLSDCEEYTYVVMPIALE